jgi:DNA-binding XRE family transcriptional regulator
MRKEKSKMRTFNKHLKKMLNDKEFRRHYTEERRLIDLSIKIINQRNKRGLTHIELARKANITQQQLSKIENGVNCNMITFLKVCNALGLKVNVIA